MYAQWKEVVISAEGEALKCIIKSSIQNTWLRRRDELLQPVGNSSAAVSRPLVSSHANKACRS
jgi:hypothetical protein